MGFSHIKRWWVQVTALIFFNLPFLSSYLKYVPVPVLNCYSCPLAAGACPIGTIQFFIIQGQIPFLTIGILFLLGIFLGRFYCGWLCPFGFYQELLGKMKKNNKNLPFWFGYLKYAVLVIMVIVLPLLLLEPVFSQFCPAGTLQAGIPIILTEWIKKINGLLPLGYSFILQMVGWFFGIKIMILFIISILSIFFKRPFCKLCPLGAIFSFFNRWKWFGNEKIDSSACHHCSLCQKNCPAGLYPPKDIHSPECLECKECLKTNCIVYQSKN